MTAREQAERDVELAVSKNQLAKEQQKGIRRSYELTRLNASVRRMHVKLSRMAEERDELKALLSGLAPSSLELWERERRKRTGRKDLDDLPASLREEVRSGNLSLRQALKQAGLFPEKKQEAKSEQVKPVQRKVSAA